MSERSREHQEFKNAALPTLQEAFHEAGGGAGALRKVGNRELLTGMSDEMLDAIEEAGFESRDTLHLYRLLGPERTEAEHDFALAYIHHMKEDILQKLETSADTDPKATNKLGTLLQVICGEGQDTRMFWTFAPYLYQELYRKGLAPTEALHALADWAGHAQDNQRGLVTLPGTEVFNPGGEFNREGQDEPSYILGPDPSGPSHRLTRAVAERMMSGFFVPYLKAKADSINAPTTH